MELLYRQAYIWTATPYSPMISYLGLLSTVVLFYYQTFTIGISYEPPMKGWGSRMVRCIFMQGMLATFVVSFIPSWTWLHSKMDCGPYVGSSPYDTLVRRVHESFPGLLQTLLKWAAMPTITWSTIGVLVVTCCYMARVRDMTLQQLQKYQEGIVVHRYDKAQLLRSQGLPF